MPEAVIVDALRTPIGALGGALARIRPDDLAALTLQALIKRNQIDPAQVEDVYLGCANQAGEDNRDVARMAILLAGFPVSVPGVTINRLCASGLTAVNLAAQAIRAGNGEIFIAGGVESMSRAPYSLPKAEDGFHFGNQTAYDTALGWRYPNPKMQERYGIDSMGETAENIATLRPHLTREKQDAYALASHQKAIAAQDAGKWDLELIPVEVPQKKAPPTLVEKDERPRRDTSLESLSRLKPAFKQSGGSVTAGNSAGMNDGAAALLLMSENRAQQLGLRPLARIVSMASAGVDPRWMGLGPVPATQKALQRAQLQVSELHLIELNEAFAVQALAVMEDLGLDENIVNPNGGAIALGHPLGCSGARLLTSLTYQLHRANLRYGLATLCVGVGQGEATIIEKL